MNFPTHNIIFSRDAFFLLRISYLFYTLVGTCSAIFVALLVGCLFGWNKNIHEIDPKLLAPGIKKYFINNVSGVSTSVDRTGVFTVVTKNL